MNNNHALLALGAIGALTAASELAKRRRMGSQEGGQIVGGSTAGADLTRANLSDSSLVTNMTGANLTWANLSSARELELDMAASKTPTWTKP